MLFDLRQLTVKSREVGNSDHAAPGINAKRLAKFLFPVRAFEPMSFPRNIRTRAQFRVRDAERCGCPAQICLPLICCGSRYSVLTSFIQNSSVRCQA